MNWTIEQDMPYEERPGNITFGKAPVSAEGLCAWHGPRHGQRHPATRAIKVRFHRSGQARWFGACDEVGNF